MLPGVRGNHRVVPVSVRVPLGAGCRAVADNVLRSLRVGPGDRVFALAGKVGELGLPEGHISTLEGRSEDTT